MRELTDWKSTKMLSVPAFRQWLKEQLIVDTDAATLSFATRVLNDESFLTQDSLLAVTKYFEIANYRSATLEEFKTEYGKYQAACSDKPITADEVTTPSALELPDMPESVLDGKLGEICKERMLPDLPVAYAWPALLAAATGTVEFSTTPGYKDKINTNLYVALVGPVHSGKSQAIQRACHLLGVLPHKLMAGSVEGMLAHLGEIGGPVLVSPDELSHLLEKAQIANATFAAVLNTLFYEDELNLTVAQRKPVKFRGRLSLIGGLIDEKFGDGFGSVTTTGFYDRFLFAQCPSGFTFFYKPIEGQPVFDAADLNTKKFLVPAVNPDVFEAVRKLRKDENINVRIAEIGLRAAMLCAAFEGKRMLNAADLGPAWELAKYQTRVRSLLVPNPGKNFEAQIAFKILACLDSAPPDKWIPRRVVLKSTKGYDDYGPVICDRVISSLVFCGEIEQVEQSSGRGPKKHLLRRTRVEPGGNN